MCKERLETRKYTFTVEGDTENWYLLWLEKQINANEKRKYQASFIIKVKQSPRKFYKTINPRMNQELIHVCDVESNEPVHVAKFKNILSEMNEADIQRGIKYQLGYSNFSFELWMVLHKKACNGPLAHRRQYLKPICQAFEESFEDLDHYKKEAAFKRCLSKLTLKDVHNAIKRADKIMEKNKETQKSDKFQGYSYYPNNPSLSIHEIIKKILDECGV